MEFYFRLYQHTGDANDDTNVEIKGQHFKSLQWTICVNIDKQDKQDKQGTENPLGCLSFVDPALSFEAPYEITGSSENLLVSIHLLNNDGVVVAEAETNILLRPYDSSRIPHVTPADLYPRVVPPESEEEREKLAYFTLMYGDDYLPGLVTLHKSLKR